MQIDICDEFLCHQDLAFSTGGADDFNFHRILNEEEGMPFWEDIDFELDLLVADAVKNFDIYIKLGRRVLFFMLKPLVIWKSLKIFRRYRYVYKEVIKIGIAINIKTP